MISSRTAWLRCDRVMVGAPLSRRSSNAQYQIRQLSIEHGMEQIYSSVGARSEASTLAEKPFKSLVVGS